MANLNLRTPNAYRGNKATSSTMGVMRFATDEEALAGVMNDVAVTPAQMQAAAEVDFSSPPPIGDVNPNTAVFTDLFAGDTQILGNLSLTQSGSQIRMKGGAVTDFIGTATLAAGTVTIANTNIAATDRIIPIRISANGSTTLGILTYTISAGASFTITSVILGTPASTQTADTSTIWYMIVRQTA